MGKLKKDTLTGDWQYPCNIAYTELAPCRALIKQTSTPLASELLFYHFFYDSIPQVRV